MELNDMKIFYAVAQLQSTTDAAEKLGFVQSHISKRISKIEQELETKLFLRSNKGMILTEDGKALLPYVGDIISRLNEINENFSKKVKVLKIGASHTIAKLYLQDYYLNDGFKVETVKLTDDLIKMLENDLLDYILTNRKIDYPFLDCQKYKEPITWVKSIEKKDSLFDKPILISDDVNCPYRRATLEYIKKNKINNVAIIEIENIDIAIEMIMNNKAIGIVPEKMLSISKKLEPLEICKLDSVFLYVYKKSS